MFQEFFCLSHLVFTVGSLLPILGFLLGRTTAMSPRNILFLLGLGLYFSFIRVFAFTASSEGNTILKNALEIVVSSHFSFINDGTDERQ